MASVPSRRFHPLSSAQAICLQHHAPSSRLLRSIPSTRTPIRLVLSMKTRVQKVLRGPRPGVRADADCQPEGLQGGPLHGAGDAARAPEHAEGAGKHAAAIAVVQRELEMIRELDRAYIEEAMVRDRKLYPAGFKAWLSFGEALDKVQKELCDKCSQVVFKALDEFVRAAESDSRSSSWAAAEVPRPTSVPRSRPSRGSHTASTGLLHPWWPHFPGPRNADCGDGRLRLVFPSTSARSRR